LDFKFSFKCDNVGAIYLSNNQCSSQRTKHINTRKLFVYKWVADDIVRILFTLDLDNTADSFTKNPPEEMFQKKAVKLVKTVPHGTDMCNVKNLPSHGIIVNLNKMNGLK
jgi:hypothetical protein